LNSLDCLDLQGQLISLIRTFGLHRLERTPCGQNVTVTEAHALIELSLDQPLSQSELVQRLGLERSSISRLVQILANRGWIERSRSPTDRRLVQIVLSSAGQKACQALSEARKQKFERVLACIPMERQQAVSEAITILVSAIHESQSLE